MTPSKNKRLYRLKGAAEKIGQMLERDAKKVRQEDIDKVEREVPEKLGRVEGEALERKAGMIGELLSRVQTLYTMIFDRNYTVGSKTKLLSVAALLYFLLPTDLVPDFIPGVGLIDDALVLRTLWSIVSKEIDRYTEVVRGRLLRETSSSSTTPSP